MRAAFNRILRLCACIFAGIFICAAATEWIRSAYDPFSGLADYPWTRGLRNFLYLMAMFNILLIRYAVMRIYIAPGHINFDAVVQRLSRAGTVSMLLSELPCIYGLILFLMTGDLIDFYLLFGLSVIYSMISMPRFKNWVSVAEGKDASSKGTAPGGTG